MNKAKAQWSAHGIACAAVFLSFFGTAHGQEQQLPKYSDSDAAQHAGEIAIVTGRVVAVAKSKGGTTYLNFGARFPRETFSGVVLVRDAEKVGDVLQFEGKTIALSGKIALRDKKPQIVITSPSQIALVGEPSAEPSSGAVKPSPDRPAKELTSSQKPPFPGLKIALSPAWNSPTQTGELTRKDLATIFSGRGHPSEATEGNPSLVIFPDVPFLAPLPEVKKRLKLEGTSSTKNKIVCPGMPLDSFWSHVFSGVFLGGFDRLCLITDAAGQVVSVQLVDDTSRQRSSDITDYAGYHTYNFVSYRVKGGGNLVVKHEVTAPAAGVVVVESTLIDPNDNEALPVLRASSRTTNKTQSRTPRTGKVLERSRWFVPAPMVNLILRCAENR